MGSPTSTRIALLIDAENTPSSCLPRVLAELTSTGLVTVRRAYGGWQGTHMRGWRAETDRHGVDRIGQDPLVRGKNASDIALVIDAMTLLHAGSIDVLAIVSSDSDFAPLAVRARQAGTAVLGFGEGKAPPAYVAACTSFTRIDLPAEVRPHRARRRFGGEELRRDEQLVGALTAAAVAARKKSGWTPMSDLVPRLADGVPVRKSDYGYRTWTGLIEATELFDVRRDGLRVRVRQRQSAS